MSMSDWKLRIAEPTDHDTDAARIRLPDEPRPLSEFFPCSTDVPPGTPVYFQERFGRKVLGTIASLSVAKEVAGYSLVRRRWIAAGSNKHSEPVWILWSSSYISFIPFDRIYTDVPVVPCPNCEEGFLPIDDYICFKCRANI